MRAWKIFLGTLALFAGGAFAADATLDSARRCVQVKDSLERLVCFDRAFAGPAAQPGQVAPVAPVAAAREPVATAPVIAAPVVSLGEESLKRKSREEPETPTSLTAKVTALKETRKDIFRMTLDNGQVWQQLDMESLFYVSVGDTVQIDKGRLGGFRMARVSNGRSGWVRVSRTQ